MPLIIQFIIVNSGASIIGVPMDPFGTGILVLSLYMGGFVAEVVTAGILAVPTTLRRAGRSLGFSYWQDLRHIVLPLSLRSAFPSWVGLLLGLMKDSSLIAVIGYIELLRASQIIINRTEQPLANPYWRRRLLLRHVVCNFTICRSARTSLAILKRVP